MARIQRSFLRMGAILAVLLTVAAMGAPAGEEARAFPAQTEYPYAGAIKTKLNAQGQPVVMENVHVTTDAFGQIKTLTVAPDGAPATGALLLNTADTATWKAPAKVNSSTWTMQTKATSSATAAVFVNGQWRALKTGATLTVKFVGNNKQSLYLKLTGSSPTGIGNGTVSVESETTSQNLDSRLTVLFTTPDDAGTLGTEQDILVAFSESLDGFDPTGTTIVCDSVDVPFTSTLANNVVTLNPTSNLPAGATCVVTIAKDSPSDADTNDPPAGLEQDYVFSFTTDAAPEVTSATPDGTTDVSTFQNFTFQFSEPVNLASGAYTYTCSPSGATAILAIPQPNVTSLLIPGVWIQNDTCTITIHASLVTDVDTLDQPDGMAADYTFNFHVDAAPFVVSTVPANGATGASTAVDGSITFSEPVTLLNGSIWTRYDCGPGFQGDVTWTNPSLGPQTVFTFPGTPFFAGKTCTNTIYVAGFEDADNVDLPNFMVANYVWTFTYAP